MTKEHLKQVELNKYILIIDEEVNLVDSDIGVRLDDIEMAFIKGMIVSDNAAGTKLTHAQVLTRNFIGC